MPFAEGPRNCVGQSLAKLSLATVVATLLQTFSFRLADEVVLCRTRVSTLPYGCTPGGAIRSAALETVFDAFGRKRLLRSWAHIDNPLQSCMQCPRAPARAAWATRVPRLLRDGRLHWGHVPAAARTQRLVLHVAEHAASRWLPCESLAICDMTMVVLLRSDLQRTCGEGCMQQSRAALRWDTATNGRAGAAQMGGAAGVAAQEHYTLVIGLSKGMLMHLDARPGALWARACPRSQQGVELFWCHICALLHPSRLHEQHHIVSANPVKDNFAHRSGAVLPGLCCTSM